MAVSLMPLCGRGSTRDRDGQCATGHRRDENLMGGTFDLGMERRNVCVKDQVPRLIVIVHTSFHPGSTI